MQIEYRTGDLMTAPEPILVQGCNAQGAMNSGVAKLIRATYPEVFTQYDDHHQRFGLKMGDVIWVDVGTRMIANAITQQFYGRVPNHRYASYDAIAMAFEQINRIGADTAGVAMPLIGAGLAQGDWQIISRIIERQCRDVQPVVYLLDGVIPE